ncbi:ribosome biogenesis regulatory protein homolog [Erythrolamprus reginae]|uniref:ribosome biogenesis regulatory protein homolog n=1 Tax=Erythrolamprus reginae TaxID=121349 RepID=UPI00396CBD39
MVLQDPIWSRFLGSKVEQERCDPPSVKSEEEEEEMRKSGSASRQPECFEWEEGMELAERVPSTRLPREKPLPRPRPLTKWEQFVRLKGIQPTRKKRGTLVWDESAQEWKQRWGYRRAGGDPSREWLMEVPDLVDPMEDQFAKRRHEKRERVARNELNRLKNLARAQRGCPAADLHPTGHQDRAEMSRVAALARVFTASRGRFQPRLPKEPAVAQTNTARGKKRRFQPLLGDLEGEKKRHRELARTLSSKNPALDLTRAVNKQLREDG